MELVEFDREPYYKEMLVWGKENSKTPMMSKHLHGIGINHPDVQRLASIVELGSVHYDRVLYLDGSWSKRRLGLEFVRGNWRQRYLFGFINVDKGSNEDVIKPSRTTEGGGDVAHIDGHVD